MHLQLGGWGEDSLGLPNMPDQKYFVYINTNILDKSLYLTSYMILSFSHPLFMQVLCSPIQI